MLRAYENRTIPVSYTHLDVYKRQEDYSADREVEQFAEKYRASGIGLAMEDLSYTYHTGTEDVYKRQEIYRITAFGESRKRERNRELCSSPRLSLIHISTAQPYSFASQLVLSEEASFMTSTSTCLLYTSRLPVR